jgi:hypothetical protein
MFGQKLLKKVCMKIYLKYEGIEGNKEWHVRRYFKYQFYYELVVYMTLIY